MIVKTEIFDVLPSVPVIVAVFALCTASEETVNVPIEEPPATVTESGTVAFVLLDARFTIVPPAGAKPLRVTVPVDVDPPVTDEGDRLTLTRVAGLIVKLADWLTPFKVPEIVAAVVEDTPVVETVNVAVVAPAATVTDVGGVAFEMFEPRETIRPLGPATLLNVTVPVEDAPPITAVGDNETLARDAGLIVRVADPELVPWVAVIVAATELETATVLIAKFAEVAPAGTVTVDCKVALVLFDERLIPTPPVAAGPVKVTVPTDFMPPVTDGGATETLRIVGGAMVSTADLDTLP